MPTLPPPQSTRLITIVAHVDHGKTTLADSLIEHNGIISERLAGSIRYLDSMAEEQRRGITIRCSAIGLRHSYNIAPSKVSKNGCGGTKEEMVIHLIDSPGHVDFSMEVTTSLQSCDGALLIVDVVEGMCARTHSILREAYSQELVPILVLNKIDRLCTDLGLDVNEAYVRIRGVIESVNAAASAMVQRSNIYMDQKEEVECSSEKELVSPLGNEKEMLWTFDHRNVVFTSAIYGFGFTISALSRSLFKSGIIPKIRPPVLRQYLFGDFKYHKDTGKVTKWKQHQNNNLTMFAEFGLKPLWDILEGISQAVVSSGLPSCLKSSSCNNIKVSDCSKEEFTNKGKIKATSIGMKRVLKSLQIGSTPPPEVPTFLMVPKTMDEMQLILQKIGALSEEIVLRTFLRRFRPLSDAVLDMVCKHCPSPAQASSEVRAKALSLVEPTLSNVSMNDNTLKLEQKQMQNFDDIKKAVRNCDPDPDSPTVAHVFKFLATDISNVNDPELSSSLKNVDDTGKIEGSNVGIIMGQARVLSGTLRAQDVEYYCFGPKYQRDEDSLDKIPRRSIRLYILMGSSFVSVSSVPAGHICGVYGLDDLQLKTVTLCDRNYGMPLKVLDRGVSPLVKVNLETVSASDMHTLERGLLKLSLADAAVEVTATSKGELILACLGEIHLEQSIFDLKNMYFGKEIDIRISDPIVEFGESTEWFKGEISDYEQFFNNKISPPLRQLTIPPYCYEEGLSFAKRGRSRVVLSTRGAAINLRVIPLPRGVYDCLRDKKVINGCEDKILRVAKSLNCQEQNKEITPESALEQLLSSLSTIDNNGNAMIASESIVNCQAIKGVLSVHEEVYVATVSNDSICDDRDGINHVSKKDENDGFEEYESVQKLIGKGGLTLSPQSKQNIKKPSDSISVEAIKIWEDVISGSVVAGFQTGCSAGPLCEEPLRGILVVLEGIEISLKYNGDRNDCDILCCAKNLSGGMVVAAMRTGIRTAFLTRPTRLVEGYLELTLHSSLTGLGSMYAILSKRRGKVISDEMIEGTDLISITAIIPQAESFRLTPEILEKSSGEVTAPELIFSHWDILDEDPFWIPTSLEEREDYGEIVMNGDSSTGIINNALKYIRMARDRKGLMVDSQKIVIAAEKQRTLARKK